MDAPLPVWICRALWLVLPLTVGDSLAAALDGADPGGRWVVVVVAWLAWAAGLGASLLADPRALTVWRVLAPVPLVVAVAAALQRTPEPVGWIGLLAAAALAVLSFVPAVGEWAIDGGSYGDEHRSPLRCPAALAAGPVPLAWVVCVGPWLAAVVAARGGAFVAAALLAAVGCAGSWFAGRSLDRLTRRALVFVPAGVTLVDPLALAEPILLARRSITRVGPAPADSAALDLSVGAPGLIVEVALDSPVAPVPAVRRGRIAEAVETPAVLVAPTRPGVFLSVAEARGLPVLRA